MLDLLKGVQILTHINGGGGQISSTPLIINDLWAVPKMLF